MSLIALGINHRTAPVELREQVAITGERITTALHDLAALPSVSEAAILSTCNRTELYCELHDDQVEALCEWLARFHALEPAEIRPHLYSFPDADAVRHLLRVAGGLDSMILGEPQILGQMKDAYQSASHAGTLDAALERLFQHTFAVAKQIRTDTAIGESPVSVAFAAVSLAKQIFSDFEQHTALLIGAGETIELCARHLAGSGLTDLVIANRSVERARILADRFGGGGIGLPEIPEVLPTADIVISSTASPLPLLGKGLVERALKQRRHRPIFMVDIAVPRDIEPEVSALEDIYLYTVDDLQEVIEEGMHSRREAAEQADEIIETQVDSYMAWLRSQDAIGTICAYRSRAEQIRREALKRARNLIRQGTPVEEALQFLAHRLTNKLTHDATHAMHHAGREGRSDTLEVARHLLNLPEE